MSEQVVRVVLVDDHEVVRRGVRDLLSLEPDIEVVGEAATVAEALARVPALRPDVVVLDVRLPDGNGVQLCRDLKTSMPALNVLMLTSFSDDDALIDAIMAGASGYVLKHIGGNDLVDAVRRVGTGGSLLDPAVTAQVLERLRTPPAGGPRAAFAHRPGTPHPRAHQRRAHEPADRRADVPRREDRQELRVEHPRQARHGAPYPSRGIRRAGRRVETAASLRVARAPRYIGDAYTSNS